ncbi:Uncharacterized protein APZ42_006680, partial [Daphnia magna]
FDAPFSRCSGDKHLPDLATKRSLCRASLLFPFPPFRLVCPPPFDSFSVVLSRVQSL